MRLQEHSREYLEDQLVKQSMSVKRSTSTNRASKQLTPSRSVMNDYSLLAKTPTKNISLTNNRGKSVGRLPKPPLAIAYHNDAQTRSAAKLESVAEMSSRSAVQSVQGHLNKTRAAANGYKSF